MSLKRRLARRVGRPPRQPPPEPESGSEFTEPELNALFVSLHDEAMRDPPPDMEPVAAGGANDAWRLVKKDGYTYAFDRDGRLVPGQFAFLMVNGEAVTGALAGLRAAKNRPT